MMTKRVEAKRYHGLRFIVGLTLLSLSLLTLVGEASIAWLLKDGLGPNAIESRGSVVFWKFWAGFKWPLMYSLVPILLGILIVAWGIRSGELDEP